MPRAVVDTNVWVSALLNRSGPPARVVAALEGRRFTLVTSEPLLAELEEVLARPRLVEKYGLTGTDRHELAVLLRSRAIVVPVTGSVQVCRDPDDDVLIETALRGLADALVTRDDDLKGAAEVVDVLMEAGVRVLSVRRFLASLDEAGGQG
jgi:putative PIN family toxin of toxin-antitoxin system